MTVVAMDEVDKNNEPSGNKVPNVMNKGTQKTAKGEQSLG